ncbi:vascular cell adhesion protein 1 isoform X2 [Rhineura floridana]|nr:vascular cell adhesion protein 1 isoform X2 [Rhineura floridana]XP_061486537.1 vascular cell adhesion protein 1 isoform X2 [Rhineura floridana]XP_061486538.1 vascular cell adhesion protein 1 isoform X2 [Rhineura floridana]
MSRGTSSMMVLFLMAILTSEAFEVQDIVPGHAVAAQIGEKLELRCRTTGCASPTFSWRSQIDSPLGGNVSHQGNSSVLTMKVGFENEQSYLCNANCEQVRKQRTVRVDIYSFPSDPVIEISHPLVLGKPATVTCIVANVYPVDRLAISLKKEERDLKKGEFPQELNNSVQTKSVVTTFNLSKEDTGKRITCTAELPIGEMESEPKKRQSTRILNVNYAPKSLAFSIFPSTTVQEGENVTLRCFAKSNPAARVIIRRKVASKDVILDSQDQNGVVCIPRVTPDDAGDYECEAENEFGKAKMTEALSVKYGPRNTTIDTIPSSTVKEGEAVTMTCFTDGNPTPSVFWKKHLASGGSLIILEGATLTIKKVRAEDMGHYECEGVNMAGKESKTVELIVQVFSPSTPELSPSTLALTDQPEAVTEVEDFIINSTTDQPEPEPVTEVEDFIIKSTTDQPEAVTEVEELTVKSTIYNTQQQETDNKKDHLENKTSLAPKDTIFTSYAASKNSTITYAVKVFGDAGNGTQEIKTVIARMEEPDYVIPVIIVASSLATAAGPMAALLIYISRKAKINGSYSLISSLKPKV